MGKRFILTLIGAVAALVMASCADDAKIAPEGVSLDRTSITMQVGDKDSLIASITPSDAHNQRVHWTSSEPNVVAVTRKGAIEALSVGKATITVTSVIGKYTATCDVVVNPISVTGITLDKTSLNVYVGETGTLTATVAPANATDKAVTWTSSNEDVVTVANGVVSGVDEGEAIITATTKDGNKVASCKVTVTLKIPTEAETLDLWKNDSKGKIAIYGGADKKTVDFLTYSGDGVVRWSENTTGKPRTATMEFSTGSKVTITQIGANDFKGDWNFTSKVFCKDGFATQANKVTLSNGIVIGEPKGGETLTDGAGKTHVNNVSVDGLYHKGVIIDAAVEIDYENKTVAFGLFLDARKAQKDTKPANAAYPYIAFLPELCQNYVDAGSWGGKYNFTGPDLGEPKYEWLWFTVSSDYDTLTYSAAKAQKLTTSNPNKYYQWICGITIASFKSEEVTIANSAAGATDVWTNTIYQFNTNAGSIGLVFTRK